MHFSWERTVAILFGFLLLFVLFRTLVEPKAMDKVNLSKEEMLHKSKLFDCSTNLKEFVLGFSFLDVNNRTNVHILQAKCHNLTECFKEPNSKKKVVENCCEILDNAATWFVIYRQGRDEDWEELAYATNLRRNEKCELEALGFPWILLDPGMCSFD